METPLPRPRLRALLTFNFLATLALAAGLLLLLRQAAENMNKMPSTQNQTEAVTQAQSSTVVDSSDTTAVQQDTTSKGKGNADLLSNTGLTFYDILLLMLLAGGLGGVLCNLRGFFMHYRGGENQSFPEHLEIPYYTRTFMGAGAGLLVYFVANFLIASITIQYVANDVPFQGMVSFIALAMLAGFGSLEFFQRMKETALSLFGQKAEKTKWERMEELQALMAKGTLTGKEYQAEKAKILGEAAFPAQIEAEILGLNELMLLYEEIGNVDRLSPLLTEDFTIQRSQGPLLNREDFLKAVPENINLRRTAEAAQLSGVGDTLLYTCIVNTAQKPDGTPNPGRFLNSRVFVPVQGEWKCAAWKVLRLPLENEKPQQ